MPTGPSQRFILAAWPSDVCSEILNAEGVLPATGFYPLVLQPDRINLS
jgi:hypothetical protein